jgi:hypothetical protein
MGIHRPLPALARPSLVIVVQVLRRGMILGVGLNLLLILYGLIRIPTTLSASGDGVTGVAGAVGILLIYGGLGLWGGPATDRANPSALRHGLFFGLAAGAVFTAEISLEYILLPDSQGNARMGLIEFGTVFGLYFLAGLWSAYQTGRIRLGTLTAFWSAVIGSLIWFIVVLSVFYLFWGTSRQVRVLTAEGNFEDFQRSGMRDFNAFIMQDFLGAGFFHLSLVGPVAAVVLGSLGGLPGKGIRWLQMKLRPTERATP